MDTAKAKRIISENYSAKKGTLTGLLNDNWRFSAERFWELYDSIVQVVQDGCYTEKLTLQISVVCQRILKEFIYHFDPHDFAEMDGFPEHYQQYLERLDAAALAYYTRNPELVQEDQFELPRW